MSSTTDLNGSSNTWVHQKFADAPQKLVWEFLDYIGDMYDLLFNKNTPYRALTTYELITTIGHIKYIQQEYTDIKILPTTFISLYEDLSKSNVHIIVLYQTTIQNGNLVRQIEEYQFKAELYEIAQELVFFKMME